MIELTVRTLEALGRLSRVEDIFAFFALRPDAVVLQEHGDGVLRAWAVEVARIDARRPAPPERERLALYEDALRRSHDAFLSARGRARLRFRVIDGGLGGPSGRER